MKANKYGRYTDYIIERVSALLAIDSPTGYTENAAEFVIKEFRQLGYKPEKTAKGGVLVCLGDKGGKDGILLESHMDTLGGMVSEITDKGRLKISPLGGLNPNNTEAENVRIITKFDGGYEGTFQLENASIHVNGEYNDTRRSFDAMEVVIDEPVRSREDVQKLGISVGDIVCFDPRTRVTESGYIKSRFLDDKLSVGILMGFAKYIKEEKVSLLRPVYVHVTVYEEVGHGGCASVPDGVTEAVSVDMGCAGGPMTCTERQVSVCAKDSGGPYSYEVVKGLIQAAKKGGADYAVDVYPHYGSDVEATLQAGYDIRHGLIGAGVYASHGYERSHRDGAENVLKLLVSYLCKG
jgi:putative aminopeptidase FrvX